MKKQIGAILLSSALCLSLIGAAFAADVDGQPGQLVYGTDSAGNTVIIELDDQGAIPEDKKDIVGDRPLTDGTNTVKPFTPGSDPDPGPTSSTDPTPTPTPGNQGGGGYYPSTPSNPSYTVGNNSGSSTNGSWSTDKSTAKKGDTVTITVRPNEGYQGTPVVKDANGNNVSVSSLGNNRFSFVMPDGRVTISTEFTPVSVAPANPFTDVRQGVSASDKM